MKRFTILLIFLALPVITASAPATAPAPALMQQIDFAATSSCVPLRDFSQVWACIMDPTTEVVGNECCTIE